MTNTSIIVNELKKLNQDHEWYPTNDRMIDLIKTDMLKYFSSEKYNENTGNYEPCLGSNNVLDCGAGDGRVGKALSNGGSVYAIEKSKHLIDQMPNDVFIVGTDFWESTLIDKTVDIIFCNPPYSEYERWVQKIISEANSKFIYLIIPTRWKNVKSIIDSIELRNATWEIIGTDDFLDAERSARAIVDIIRINIKEKEHYKNHLKTDPFDIWFETNFKINAKKETSTDWKNKETSEQTLKNKINKQLINGCGLVPALVKLYDHEMDHLMKTFYGICELDSDILNELNVDMKSVKEALKLRITGLKNKYWAELFKNYDKITRRLTHSSRKSILHTLTSNTNIDFTETNIYAVSVWVIKNANKYYDSQLIKLVDQMIDQANVTLYKSNKRLYTDQDWRSKYGRKLTPENLQQFGLELRIILEGYNAIVPSDREHWYYHDYENGLHKTRHNFIDDIITIANNLGFETPLSENSRHKDEWVSNKNKEFYYNEKSDIQPILMRVKAFKNGNMHIKFNKAFIRALNVEFGRLKGWLHNHTQASEELNIPLKDAEKLFKVNFHLTSGNGLLQIGFKPEVD